MMQEMKMTTLQKATVDCCCWSFSIETLTETLVSDGRVCH